MRIAGQQKFAELDVGLQALQDWIDQLQGLEPAQIEHVGEQLADLQRVAAEAAQGELQQPTDPARMVGQLRRQLAAATRAMAAAAVVLAGNQERIREAQAAAGQIEAPVLPERSGLVEFGQAVERRLSPLDFLSAAGMTLQWGPGGLHWSTGEGGEGRPRMPTGTGIVYGKASAKWVDDTPPYVSIYLCRNKGGDDTVTDDTYTCLLQTSDLQDPNVRQDDVIAMAPNDDGDYPYYCLDEVMQAAIGSRIWWPKASDIPAGWQECDGTNGTPDSRGQELAVYKSGDADFGTIGNAGGAKTHGHGAHSHGLNFLIGCVSSGTTYDSVLTPTQDATPDDAGHLDPYIVEGIRIQRMD